MPTFAELPPAGAAAGHPFARLERLDRRGFLKLTAAAALGAAVLGGRVRAADDPRLEIGYIPITDATPLLLAHARGAYAAHGLDAAPPRLFRSWASLIEAFLARQVNLVHVLMPISVWLRYAREVPVKVVAWTHTNGSAFTVAPDVDTVTDLAGRTVAVPFWYSIHNVALQHLLRLEGLRVTTRERPADHEVGLVVLPPPEMPAALAAGGISGFVVADPFNAMTEALGVGRVLRFTGDVWHQHACCVTLMHEDDLRERPAWARAAVAALVETQGWLRDNRAEGAALLGDYLPQPADAIRRVLLDEGRADRVRHPDWEPNPWIDFQPYPFPSYTERLVEFLKRTEVEGDRAFLAALDPAAVHADLVEEAPVLQAIGRFGGAARFGLPPDLRRAERIEGAS